MPSRLQAKAARDSKREEARQAIEEERLRQEALERGDVEEEEQEEEKPPEPQHQWLLVIGGMDGATVHASTELLHYQGEAFEEGLTLASPRWGCAAIVLEGPRILVAGGFDGEAYLNTTEILDLKAWTVEPGPPMSIPRAGLSMVRVDARQILVIGGYSQDSCEILDVESMRFRPGPQLRKARACAAAMMLDSDRLMIAGGYDRLGCCKETEIMDLRKAPTEDEWDLTTPPNVEKARFLPWTDLKVPRGGCAITLMPGEGSHASGRVLFVGGFEGKKRVATTELLDLANYNISCERRPALVDETVLSLSAEALEEQLFKPKKKKKKQPEGEEAQEGAEEVVEEEEVDEEEEVEEEEEGDEPPKPKVKFWALQPGELATVLQLYEEGVEDQDGHEDAEQGMFMLRNPGGYDSTWLKMKEFAYPPTHQMCWEPAGPSLQHARSGAAAALLPTIQMGEGEQVQGPRLFVLGGCSEVPNEGLNATEVLDLVASAEFAEGFATGARRAYCAAVTVTVVGDIGKPKPEEEPAPEDVEAQRRLSTVSSADARRLSTGGSSRPPEAAVA